MELLEVISTRRSVRRFTDKPVTEEMIKTIISAAMLAPSAGNQQSWHFIVVTERMKLDKVAEFHPYAKMIRNVNVAIVVCGAPEGLKWGEFWVQDCSAALQNLLLAARDLGLGTVWTGVYPVEDRMVKTRELFSIPKEVYPLAIVPVGWPAEEFKPAQRYRPELVHRNTW